MKRSELFFNVILLPVDAIMILSGFVVAYFLRANWDFVPVKGTIWSFDHYIRFGLTMLPIWIAIFTLEGLYNIKNARKGIGEFTGIIMSISAGIMITVIWIFFSKTEFFSRLIVIYIWLACLLFVIAGRIAVRLIQTFLYQFNFGTRRIVYIGWDDQIGDLAQMMRRKRFRGYKFIGYYNEENLDNNYKYLGTISDMLKSEPKEIFDEIILSDSNIAADQKEEIVNYCNDNKIVFKLIPNAYEMKATNINVLTMAGIPVLEYSRTPLSGWGKVIKRLIDLLGSSIIITILSPLFLIISILIKLNSKGPVLFCQARVGRNGHFICYKFRSMKLGADKEHEEYIKKYGNMFKLKDDPRVTPIGKFLRKTSLDELPQLFNVFLGSMSLVGPRPPMVEEVKYYTKWQRQRLGIKPGITGLWQVSGRSDLSFDEWVKLDLYYIENWSLWLDIKILFKTIWVVLVSKGAY